VAGLGALARTWLPSSEHYSPNVGEEEFSEVRAVGTLRRSWVPVLPFGGRIRAPEGATPQGRVG
jgi:hypothetical protein